MKEEIAAAVFFVGRLVRRYGRLGAEGRERFAAALTCALFETFKNHWHPEEPGRGQAYRCLRTNRLQLQDPVLLQACGRSGVRYEDLGLPAEVTIWVDPGEVSCRYGERSAPFCVSVVAAGRRGDGEFSRRIHNAVERAGLDVRSGSSSDEDAADAPGPAPDPAQAPPPNPEAKTIPTVSNPNSVYRFCKFAPGAPQSWLMYPKRKAFPGEPFPPHAAPLPPPPPPPPSQKAFKTYRATFSFTGPRVDKYHWVSKTRS